MKIKRFISALLIFTILISSSIIISSAYDMSEITETSAIPIDNPSGGSGVKTLINNVLTVYNKSGGMYGYFTKTGKANTYSSTVGSNCELANIPSRGGLPSGKTIMNQYGVMNSWSCMSFAKYVYAYIFGSDPQNTSKNIIINGAKRGDLVVGDYVRINGSHSAIYLGSVSNGFYVYHGNYDGCCGVIYGTFYSWNNSIVASHARNYKEVNGAIEEYDTPIIMSITNKAKGPQVVWDKVIGAPQYKVFRKKAGNTVFTELGLTTKTSYTDTTAKNNTTYIYSVQCYSKNGRYSTSPFDNVGKQVTFYAPPKLSSVNAENSGNKIKFKEVEGIIYYRIYRKVDGDSWKAVADTVNTTYTDMDVTDNHKYTYTVRCLINRTDEYTLVSAYNSTGITVNRISAPKNFSITNEANGQKVKWSKVSGAEKYLVFYKNGSSWKKLGYTTKTSYLNDSAKNTKNYTYTVRCVSSDKTQYQSSYDSKGISNTYYTVPVLKKLSLVEDGLKLTFSKIDGLDSYKIYRKVDGGSYKAIATTSKSSYTDKTAKSNTKVTYTVRALDKDGILVTSYNKTGLSKKYYATPKIYKTKYSNGKFTIYWNKVDGVSQYKISYYDGGWKKLATTTKTSYTIKSKNNKIYKYTVVGQNKKGKSITTYVKSGYTIKYHNAPVLKSIKVDNSIITLNWSKVTGCQNYKVLVKENGESKFKELAITNTTSYELANPVDKTKYTFTVVCLDDNGTKIASSYDTTGLSIDYFAPSTIDEI